MSTRTLDVTKIYELSGTLQHYAWGHPHAIQELLGLAVDGPVAEYWMGAHSRSPSTITADGGQIALDGAVASDPDHHLGAGRRDFPFLFKVLAAAEPLSIQTHPSTQQAETGFDREEAAGVPLDASQRIFRDRSAKPELIVAIDTFQARVGLRPLSATVGLLEALRNSDPDRWSAAGGDELMGALSAGGYRDALSWLLGRDEATQTEWSRIAQLAATTGRLSQCDGVTLAAAADAFPGDVGVVVLGFLNHVTLNPGDGLYLRAGTLHAYVEGVGVEVMANSDNVVRGGLTPKHIDVSQLLAIMCTDPETPEVQTPTTGAHRYDTADAGFSLVGVRSGDYVGRSSTPRIVLVTEGTAVVSTPNEQRQLASGQVVYVPAASEEVTVRTDGTAWVAEGQTG